MPIGRGGGIANLMETDAGDGEVFAVAAGDGATPDAPGVDTDAAEATTLHVNSLSDGWAFGT